jgi:hypothetical protein
VRKASFGQKPSISNCHAFMRYPRGPASRHRGIVKGDLLAPENIVDVHIRRPDEREPGGLSAARCSGRACDASNIGSVWLSCIPQQKRDEPSAFPPLKAIRRKMGRFWLSQNTIPCETGSQNLGVSFRPQPQQPPAAHFSTAPIVFGTAADGSSQLNPPFGEAPYLAILSHAP